jgi:uncharacterized protein (TIGR02145 family)
MAKDSINTLQYSLDGNNWVVAALSNPYLSVGDDNSVLAAQACIESVLWETSARFSVTQSAAITPYTLYVKSGEGCVATMSMDVAAKACIAPNATASFEEFFPSPDAAVGTIWNLTDTRANGNNQTYKVKKMADGHIWMVRDLKFGNCTDASLGMDQTSADIINEPTVAPGYVGHCRTSPATAETTGYLYNWAAVLNDPNAYAGWPANVTVGCSGTAGEEVARCRGICPEGWHVPTGYGTGEFTALGSVMCPAGDYSCWTTGEPWEQSKAGYFNGTSMAQVNAESRYWTSTSIASHDVGVIFCNACQGMGVGVVPPYHGNPVRCVRNY